MPTFGGTHERNGKIWIAAMQQVEKEMLDAGWIKRSKKFSEVKLKRALKRYRELM